MDLRNTMRGGPLSALLERHEPRDGPWRARRVSPRSRVMSEGLVELISRCWLRHPPGYVGSPAAGGPDRNRPERGGTGSIRSVASAMAHLDLSWLVWSITGSDHEARLGGVGPGPVQ
eukprot:229640-Pyramimonas_sp.AAC.1